MRVTRMPRTTWMVKAVRRKGSVSPFLFWTMLGVTPTSLSCSRPMMAVLVMLARPKTLGSSSRVRTMLEAKRMTFWAP